MKLLRATSTAGCLAISLVSGSALSQNMVWIDPKPHNLTGFYVAPATLVEPLLNAPAALQSKVLTYSRRQAWSRDSRPVLPQQSMFIVFALCGSSFKSQPHWRVDGRIGGKIGLRCL